MKMFFCTRLPILTIGFIVSHSSLCQTNFTSNKYSYTFSLPEGWYIKDKIYSTDVDAKAIDGKGNSFVVAIKTFDTPAKETTTQQFDGLTNEAIENQFNGIYGNCEVVKRGTIFIGGREFYYIHITAPLTENLKVYHKLFYYSQSYQTYTIDACSISNQVNETAQYFSLMITSFKFH